MILYSIIFVGSLLGNTLVLYIVSKRSHTRQALSFLFKNSTVAGVLVTVFVIPISVSFYFRDNKWIGGIGGELVCRLYTYCYAVAIAAYIFTLCAMTFDRFMAVIFPLMWHDYCTHKVCTLGIWSSSTIFMFPMLLIHSSQNADCMVDWSLLKVDPFLGSKVLYSIFFVVLYLSPLLLMTALYSVICRQLWRRQRPGLPAENNTRGVHKNRKVVKLLITVHYTLLGKINV